MSVIPKEVLGLRVQVVRSSRRTSALHILGNELQVRVPYQFKNASILEMLASVPQSSEHLYLPKNSLLYKTLKLSTKILTDPSSTRPPVQCKAIHPKR